MKGAWPHAVALVRSPSTEKRLLLATIEAVGSIRPREAADILDELADFSDEDIADAVSEALAMAAGLPAEEDEDDDVRP